MKTDRTSTTPDRLDTLDRDGRSANNSWSDSSRAEPASNPSRKPSERPVIEISRNPVRKSYTLRCEQFVEAPRDKVFAFFSDACELERLTPPWLKFSVLTPAPIDLHPGRLIDYKLRVHGIPLRWQSRIETWEPPHRFSDFQVRGPYRLWNHLHTFEEVDDGTLCLDEVEYAFWGGKLVHNLFVRRDLERIFAYRSRVLREVFATRPS